MIGDGVVGAYCAGSSEPFARIVAAAWADHVPRRSDVQASRRGATILPPRRLVEAMRVLARIPRIDADMPAGVAAAEPPPEGRDDSAAIVAVAEASAAEPLLEAPAGPPSDRPLPRALGRSSRDDRRRAPGFPLKSVVALGILAAVAWSLASWSEQQRLARHREERMARISQAFQTQGTTR